MVSCDEAVHLLTHEDDFLKVSVIIQETRESIIYKQFSNEEPCLNTQNPHQNNQGILSDTLLAVIDLFVQIKLSTWFYGD